MKNELEKEIALTNNNEFTLKQPEMEYLKLQNKNKSTYKSNNTKNIINDKINSNNKNNNKNNIYLNKFKNLNKTKKIKKNIHVFSTINDYWEKREKKNKIKMEKIKKEREQKTYGNIYAIPKINRNTQEIIQRIKEQSKNKISEEDQIEDQINRNVPIKTERRKIYFKNNFKNIKKKKTINKENNTNNNSIIDYKDSYIYLMKLKNNRKRTITPKTKNINSIIRKKIPNNYNKKNNILNTNEIKSMEKIIKLRKDQEKERMKKFQTYENLNKIKNNENNNSLKEYIKKENMTTEIRSKNTKKYKKILNNNNYSMNILTCQKKKQLKKLSKNIKLKSSSVNNYSLNSARQEDKMSNIMKQRRHLNEIYNTDKRIINHSYAQSSSSRNNTYSQTRASNQRKIRIFYKYKINNAKSFPELLKTNNSFSKNNNVNLKINNKNKKPIINLYNSKDKSLRYQHYTENNKITNTINIKPSLRYINIIKDRSFFNNYSQNHKVNNNNICYSYNNENKENYRSINNLNDMNIVNYFNNYINKINNDNKLLYKPNSNNSKNNKDKINNNIYNEFGNKLFGLKKNNQKLNQRYLPINITKSNEDSNNHLDINTYMLYNNQTVKNILNSEQQKIENSLNYYNKELEINQKKKEMLLNDIYGGRNNYIKNKSFFKSESNNNIDNSSIIKDDKYINEKIEIKKDKEKSINDNYEYQNNYILCSFGNEEKNKTNNNIEDNDIVGNFTFERKHKF